MVRPTSTRQILALSTPVAVSIAIFSGWPSEPITLSIGSRSKSVLRYNSCCQPSASSIWRKYPWAYKSPTPISGMPRSLALLRWSPDSTPKPPE